MVSGLLVVVLMAGFSNLAFDMPPDPPTQLSPESPTKLPPDPPTLDFGGTKCGYGSGGGTSEPYVVWARPGGSDSGCPKSTTYTYAGGTEGNCQAEAQCTGGGSVFCFADDGDCHASYTVATDGWVDCYGYATGC